MVAEWGGYLITSAPKIQIILNTLEIEGVYKALCGLGGKIKYLDWKSICPLKEADLG